MRLNFVASARLPVSPHNLLQVVFCHEDISAYAFYPEINTH